MGGEQNITINWRTASDNSRAEMHSSCYSPGFNAIIMIIIITYDYDNIKKHGKI